MANFGPPGGGSPDPWGEPPAHPYDPPAQRYEPPVSWDGGRPAGPAPYQGYPGAGPGYGGQQPYAEPTPPKRGKGPLVTALVVLVLLGFGGAGAFWFLGRDDPAEPGGTGAPASASTDPSGQPSQPADPVTTAPAPASSTDPRFAQAGQCLRNDGSVDQPELVISECGAKTYQVLRRIDGATSGKKDAETKCAKVDGYTDWYFFDSELDTLDFVLCLKRR